jgi:hypothetical protein
MTDFRKDDVVEVDYSASPGEQARVQGRVTRIITSLDDDPDPILAILADGHAPILRSASKVRLVRRPALDTMAADAPEGFFRDSSGTLHRQHDLCGGPHDEPPPLPRIPEGHETITRDELERALRELPGIQLSGKGRGRVEYPDLVADAIFRAVLSAGEPKK